MGMGPLTSLSLKPPCRKSMANLLPLPRRSVVSYTPSRIHTFSSPSGLTTDSQVYELEAALQSAELTQSDIERFKAVLQIKEDALELADGEITITARFTHTGQSIDYVVNSSSKIHQWLFENITSLVEDWRRCLPRVRMSLGGEELDLDATWAAYAIADGATVTVEVPFDALQHTAKAQPARPRHCLCGRPVDGDVKFW